MPDRTLFWRDGNKFAVRSGPWKLLQPDEQQFRLFDLHYDPEEKHGVATLLKDQVRRMLNPNKAREAEMGL